MGPPTRAPGEGINVPNTKWGKPDSWKAYGHSQSEHDAKRNPQELKDRARDTNNPQGQFNDDKLIVEAERRAPLEPDVGTSSTWDGRSETSTIPTAR